MAKITNNAARNIGNLDAISIVKRICLCSDMAQHHKSSSYLNFVGVIRDITQNGVLVT
jgi:hypothetical protein